MTINHEHKAKSIQSRFRVFCRISNDFWKSWFKKFIFFLIQLKKKLFSIFYSHENFFLKHIFFCWSKDCQTKMFQVQRPFRFDLCCSCSADELLVSSLLQIILEGEKMQPPRAICRGRSNTRPCIYEHGISVSFRSSEFSNFSEAASSCDLFEFGCCCCRHCNRWPHEPDAGAAKLLKFVF